MARFQPACLDRMGKFHRFVIDCQKEIDYRIHNPEPILEGIDFNDLTIRFLRLKLLDNLRILEKMHSY